jgi:8-oxo-dGTP diphosphatase
MKIYSKHKRLLVAVDCIIFGYDIFEKEIKLLVIKRSFEASSDKWSLAGGFVKKDESLDEAAGRILRKLTGLEDIYMKQSYTYGNIDRDPGARVISTAYFALLRIQDINANSMKENNARWYKMKEPPSLIFDHTSMVEKAFMELQIHAKIKPVGFELLPEKFTLVQLQDLYEAIYHRTFDKRNFRKKILSMNILVKLEEKEKKTSRKGSFYFRFSKERYENLLPNGFSFNMDVN